ncbi:MAG: hypothetical protein LBP19_04210 [Treponema sp.]|nr:hypothetical protein [Treponema sp.]
MNRGDAVWGGQDGGVGRGEVTFMRYAGRRGGREHAGREHARNGTGAQRFRRL